MSGAVPLPLWTDAYLGDTPHFTTVQHGAYLLILIAMWRGGGFLPNDERRLARIARLSLDKWRRASPEIMELLTVKDGKLTQKRLGLELKTTLGRIEKYKLAGRAGGEATALKNKDVGHSDADSDDVETPAAIERQSPSFLCPMSNVLEDTATPSGVAPAQRKRGTRLPLDWTPSEDDRGHALGKGLTPEDVVDAADEFRDYWSARSGREATKLDWSATWRNSIRRYVERKSRFGPRVATAAGKPRGGGSRPVSFIDVIAERRSEGSAGGAVSDGGEGLFGGGGVQGGGPEPAMRHVGRSSVAGRDDASDDGSS